MQNYPNPFNPTTRISFSIPKDTRVALKIFNILGEEVSVLVNGELKAGVHHYEFNGQNLASGFYIYSIETPDFRDIKKMMLVK